VVDVEVSKSPARDDAGATIYFVIWSGTSPMSGAQRATLPPGTHDRLTGLANRVLFEDRLSQAHARAARPRRVGRCVLMASMTSRGERHFRPPRRRPATRSTRAPLGKVTRSSDTLCRFGGDEFSTWPRDCNPGSG